MLAACLPLHSSRRLVRAPVPVQLSPLAPPGELLRAEKLQRCIPLLLLDGDVRRRRCCHRGTGGARELRRDDSPAGR